MCNFYCNIVFNTRTRTHARTQKTMIHICTHSFEYITMKSDLNSFWMEIWAFWWMKLVWRCFATHTRTQTHKCSCFNYFTSQWNYEYIYYVYYNMYEEWPRFTSCKATAHQIQHQHRRCGTMCMMCMAHELKPLVFLIHFFPFIWKQQQNMLGSCIGQHEIVLVVA